MSDSYAHVVLTSRKPRDIPRPGADSSGNPHPDQTAANKAKGVDVYLVMAYSRPGLTADTFKVRRWSFSIVLIGSQATHFCFEADKGSS